MAGKKKRALMAAEKRAARKVSAKKRATKSGATKKRGPKKGAASKGSAGPRAARAAVTGNHMPPASKLYSPGEVVRASDVSRQVLHNYTVLGLLQPAEVTETNRRYYDERVFRRLQLIKRMLTSGYTLGDLREVFRWQD